MKLGIDVGSTTVKLVLLDDENKILYKRYERHMSSVFDKVAELLTDFRKEYEGEFHVTITGSGGLSLSNKLQIPFEQEVVTCSAAVTEMIPQTDVVIELGGEDAKITFYEGTIEQRMNGTCAGGTGAFIDQMAVLLNTDASGLNELAKSYQTIYPIAARCGVFAKTDIQPLINEGASHEDLAVSIFQAVVNQTISGLACGRVIRGNVAFLGGPLSFLSELRRRFIETLGLAEDQVIFPEDSQYYVAVGAALMSEKYPAADLDDTIYHPERQLDAHIIEELSKCEWIDQGKNLVITGKTSSGKSYLANALCICALRQFKTARYIKASQLINELSKAEKLDNYQEELSIYAGYDLLVVDDFGLMSMDVNKCRNLFEVFDSRDPHKSILVISQFPVSSWYDMFQDHTYAEACLARLLSGAYRLEMNGKNMRNMEPINKQ